MVGMVSVRQRFRAALEGLVASDRWLADQGQTMAVSPSPWPSSPWLEKCLAVAQHCAQGTLPQGPVWQRHFQHLDKTAFPVIAFPILLANASSYDHQRQTVIDWAQDLELGEEAIAVLDDGLMVLGNLVAQGFPPLLAAAPSWPLPLRSTQAFSDALSLVHHSQGQFNLALALAHRLNWPGASLGLVGGIAALATGTLPLWLRPQGDRSPNDAHLGALVNDLYGRWVGVRPGVSTHPQDRSLPIGG
jgi:hypothetical protein